MRRCAFPVRALIAFALAATATAGIAQAQNYPTKAVRLIVPFPPGGPTDMLARTVGAKLSESLGQPVTIENKGGAGGVIGTESAGRAAPDGYTITMGTSSTHAINASLFRKLPYDPVKDFIPISVIAKFPNLVVVNTASPFKTVQEMIAYAKANPGKLSYGSGGNGTTQHLGPELFKTMAGVDIVHVPYKGAGPALADLMGGQISVMFDNTISALPHVKSGKLRVLAVTTAKRIPTMPDYPTVSESGVPGFEIYGWQGIMAPANTPAPIIRRLNADIVKALRQPDVLERLTTLEAEVVGNSPEEFAALLKEEIPKWAKVVKASGAQID